MMSLSSSGLDAFFICAQEQNFTRAAERLHITQSALSQRILNLEAELGTTLFIRERTGARLTGEGEELLKYCHSRAQMEQELLGTLSTQSKELSGSLRIGGYSSVLRSVVLPALAKLLHSNRQVQLHSLSEELYELPSLLKSGKIDFMILDHAYEKEGIVAEFLGYEENVRVRKKGQAFNDTFLDHDEQDETTLKFLKLKSGARIRRHYLDEIYGIIDGVRLGLGDAIVPRHLVEGVAGIEVVDKERVLKNGVYLHFPERAFYSKLHKAVVEELKAKCGLSRS